MDSGLGGLERTTRSRGTRGGLWGVKGARESKGALGKLLFQNSFLDQKHHRLGTRGIRGDYFSKSHF